MLHSDYPLQALLYTVVAAPLPALAAARLRPRAAPRAACSTSTCAACAVRTPRSPTGTRRASSAGGRRPAWWSRCPTCSTPGRRVPDDHPGDRGPLRPPARARAPPGCSATSTSPGVIDAADVHVARRLSRARRRDRRRAWRWRSPSRCAPCAAARSASTWRPSARDTGLDDLPVAGARRLAWPRWPRARWPASRRCCGSTTTGLLYLDRYWREEEQVCADLLGRPALPPLDGPAQAALEAGLTRVFPAAGYDEQRAAAAVALRAAHHRADRRPGHRQDHHGGRRCWRCSPSRPRPPSRAAAADRPGRTHRQGRGPAAAGGPGRDRRPAARSDRDRLTGLHAVTLHRLLGSRPDSSTRFRHHRDNRLPHDVVVVDETSMVSLTMMARLLEAVRPETRLILVGDPDQLTSVEAGAVLADLVDGLGARSDTRIAALRTSHRFGESIRRLAAAVRDGDADEVLHLLRRRRRPRRAGRGRRPGAAAARRAAPAGAGAAGRCGGRRRDGGAGPARRAPAAVRAPRRPARRPPLEPARRALDQRGDRGRHLVGVVPRPPAAGHRQRLRSRPLQRRHRRRRAPARRAPRRRSRRPPGRSSWPPAGSATSRRCTR